MKTITFTRSEMIDIRNTIGSRLYKIDEYLPQHERNSPLQRRYITERDALNKLQDALDMGRDVTLTIGSATPTSPTSPTSPRDKVAAYLYENYDHTIVGAFIYVFNKSIGSWDFFTSPTLGLLTSLLDEDFTFYRDSMYPTNREYTIIPTN